MKFKDVLKVIMESPQADNNVLREYKKWCDDNKEYVGTENSLNKFAETYYKNADDIKKFIRSVITIK